VASSSRPPDRSPQYRHGDCRPGGVLCILPRMYQRLLPVLLLLSTAAPALGQVTVDLKALDTLPGSGASPPPVKAAPRPHRATPHSPTRSHAAAKPTKPPAAAAPSAQANATTAAPPAAPRAPVAPQAVPVPVPPAATLPTGTPPTVALAPPPPPAAPATPEAPPPPPPIVEGAASAASPTGTGLRVTFGAGQADLSPDSAGSIKALVQGTPQAETTSFNVVAFAAGPAEDPSAARRLSLSRALAIRSALIADGVSSTRIYVRALGL
jgi:outer membrane protein OmpA-like peptidoglycan-associated protein